MRTVKPVQVLWTLALAAVVLLPLAGVAFASVDDVSIERSGSIIVFPKVVWAGTCVGGTKVGAACATNSDCTGGGVCNVRDTIIQIANTSNGLVHARCFYVNGADPTQCSETDFEIWLTRKQPTHWVASIGRLNNMMFSGDLSGNDAVELVDNNVGNSGFFPGLIPPVQQGFIGELKCVQVDPSDAPLRMNALKGEATIRSLSGDVSEYNAIAFRGNPDLGVSSPDPNDLTLDLTVNTDEQSPGANDTGEYSACPDTLLLNHLTEGSPDDVVRQLGDCDPAVCISGLTAKIGTACTVNSDCGTNGVCGGCPISTELTLVPCSQNLEDQFFRAVTVQFTVYNEFEQPFSASTTVTCYLNVPLSRIHPTAFSFTTLGSLGAYSRITPNPGKCDTIRGVCNAGSTVGASCGSDADCPSAGGVIGVAEEFRAASTTGVLGSRAAAAYNLQTEGNRFDAATNGDGGSATGVTDHIIIPQP